MFSSPIVQGDAVVDRLITACEATEHVGLVRLSRSGRVTPMDAVAMPEDLFGWLCPRGWFGAGLVFRGRVSAGSSPPDPGSTLVRVGALATRDGRRASWAQLDSGLVVEASSPIGVVPDTCRRVLGLASDSRMPWFGDALNAEWLSVVLHHAADPALAAAVRSWEQLVGLHPVVVDPRCSPEGLGRAVERASGDQQWEAAWAHASLHGAFDLTPAEAVWMDVPMFARWAVGSYRPAADVIADLSLFLPSHLLASMCSVMLESRPPAHQFR